MPIWPITATISFGFPIFPVIVDPLVCLLKLPMDKSQFPFINFFPICPQRQVSHFAVKTAYKLKKIIRL